MVIMPFIPPRGQAGVVVSLVELIFLDTFGAASLRFWVRFPVFAFFGLVDFP
jgi:hypothetical protein